MSRNASLRTALNSCLVFLFSFFKCHLSIFLTTEFSSCLSFPPTQAHISLFSHKHCLHNLDL